MPPHFAQNLFAFKLLQIPSGSAKLQIKMSIDTYFEFKASVECSSHVPLHTLEYCMLMTAVTCGTLHH